MVSVVMVEVIFAPIIFLIILETVLPRSGAYAMKSRPGRRFPCAGGWLPAMVLIAAALRAAVSVGQRSAGHLISGASPLYF